jgi:hypothetical protein
MTNESEQRDLLLGCELIRKIKRLVCLAQSTGNNPLR